MDTTTKPVMRRRKSFLIQWRDFDFSWKAFLAFDSQAKSIDKLYATNHPEQQVIVFKSERCPSKTIEVLRPHAKSIQTYKDNHEASSLNKKRANPYLEEEHRRMNVKEEDTKENESETNMKIKVEDTTIPFKKETIKKKIRLYKADEYESLQNNYRQEIFRKIKNSC